jgi:thiamine transporter
MKINKTRMICEAAIFIAMAEILSLIKLYEFPNGGSITLEMLPIILFAARYGCGWGSLAGLVYGTITYLIGNKFSVDWTTIICDYFIAFVALGFGAGLLSRRKWSVYYGTVIGGVLRFLAHFLIGVFVWGKWMPDTFLGKPMTSPWIYSLIYNGSYMLPSIVLCLVVFALISRCGSISRRQTCWRRNASYPLRGRAKPPPENFFKSREKSVDKRRKTSIISFVRQEHSGIV